jgi:hypothetical protein
VCIYEAKVFGQDIRTAGEAVAATVFKLEEWFIVSTEGKFNKLFTLILSCPVLPDQQLERQVLDLQNLGKIIKYDPVKEGKANASTFNS